ncbi:MAG: helix-turn-helix domain-containing protein [Candidatus Krumholzibacteriaceae bacterium]
MKLLTEKQVAEEYNLSLGSLRRWRHEGTVQLPFIKIGAIVRYNAADVEAFIVSHVRTSTRDNGRPEGKA